MAGYDLDLANSPGHSSSRTGVSRFCGRSIQERSGSDLVWQISGKFVAKLFVKALENTTIIGLHGSEILG
jgi:hypothetical protein